MAAEIKFRISRTGEVNIEVDGITGASCQQITKAFEDALGVKTDSQVKPEWFIELEGTRQYVSEDGE